jgi:hypothetical protein
MGEPRVYPYIFTWMMALYLYHWKRKPVIQSINSIGFQMNQYFTFPNEQDARDYRHEHGTGGWIFVPECDKPAFYPFHDVILFPPEFTPTAIFNHPFTKGRTGKLIGAQ